MFYIVTNTPEERTSLIAFLKQNNIHAVFHYLSLHKSLYAEKYNLSNANLPMSDMYTEQLVRLPLYYSMELHQVDQVINSIYGFFKI